jgi:hypothetical protein
MNYFAKHKVRTHFHNKMQTKCHQVWCMVHLWCREDLTNELMQADALISVWFLNHAHTNLLNQWVKKESESFTSMFFSFFSFS